MSAHGFTMYDISFLFGPAQNKTKQKEETKKPMHRYANTTIREKKPV
jgi:hypothetical protein